MKEMNFLNGKDWSYNQEKRELEIGDNHLVMFVKEENGKFFFAFSDTPIILEMVKS
jgi:hypothetical protein